MKSLLEQVLETHVVTETETGPYCWPCTVSTGIDTPFPCPTVARAEELDAMTPLSNPEA